MPTLNCNVADQGYRDMQGILLMSLYRVTTIPSAAVAPLAADHSTDLIKPRVMRRRHRRRSFDLVAIDGSDSSRRATCSRT